MNHPTVQARYSIAAVSKLTGVSCHALRVWERRYGFPVPQRSASGHRRYGAEEVGLLIELTKKSHNGRSIGELIGEHQSGQLERGRPDPIAEPRSAAAEIVDSLFTGDIQATEGLIDRWVEALPPLEQVERVIWPALVEIGERWFRRECDIFEEHYAAATMLARLARLLDEARRANARSERTVLVGTIMGDRHEGGVLMLCLALELAGWRALPMGVEVPVAEYRKAIEAWKPSALCLSFVLSRNINKRFEELASIRDVPVFVGGRSIVNHQGLAKKHGLIPLIGTLSASTSSLIAAVERWERQRPSRN